MPAPREKPAVTQEVAVRGEVCFWLCCLQRNMLPWGLHWLNALYRLSGKPGLWDSCLPVPFCGYLLHFLGFFSCSTTVVAVTLRVGKNGNPLSVYERKVWKECGVKRLAVGGPSVWLRGVSAPAKQRGAGTREPAGRAGVKRVVSIHRPFA